jgi:hypothetical protein
VNDAATLITAITGLVTAATGFVGAVVLLVRSLRRSRAAATPTVAEAVAEAAADGEVTPDELLDIARRKEAGELE